MFTQGGEAKDVIGLKGSNFIMICLLIEHIFGMVIDYYRVGDIYKNGKIDMNGIKRAPTETLLGNIQFFIDCLIIGFALKHFIENPEIHA